MVAAITKIPAPLPASIARASNKSPQTFGPGFRDTLQQLEKSGPLGPGLHREVVALQDRIVGGQQVSNRDLLVYQVRVGQLNLRTELLSKVAEGFLSMIKRFQNGQ